MAQQQTTILLVEDDGDVAPILVEMLEEEGYRVLSAASAREALALCDRHPGPIDLLVTDVVMPLMTGTQLADLLSARYPGLRILFVSGFGDVSAGCARTAVSKVRCLPKPIGGSRLIAAVQSMLSG